MNMFLRAGVFPESVLSQKTSDENDIDPNADPVLKRQVEVICHLVVKYISIMIKTIKYQIPKIVTCYLIDTTRCFIRKELMRVLLTEGSCLLEDCKDEVNRRTNLMQTYNALKEAEQFWRLK